MRRVIAALLLAIAAVGCGSKSTPTTASPSIDLTGTWATSLTVLGTTARMTWTLTQRDTAVTGPVTVSLLTGTVIMNGFLTGTLTGSNLTYTITVGAGGIPTQPTCVGQIGGTMVANIGAVSTLSGTPAVTGSNCTPPIPGGPLTLTKQ